MQYLLNTNELSLFPIQSDEIELLLNIKTHKTVDALAKNYRRDISVISRKLTTLSKKYPVLTKQNNKWTITPYGERIILWAQDSLRTLNRSLLQKEKIRIGTTREFASRILSKDLSKLVNLNTTNVEIISDDQGIERLILDGQVDFGFDCTTPYDPQIAFKLIAKEDMGLVCSPKYSKTLSNKFISQNSSDYIHNYRNDLNIYYELIQKTDNPKIIAHDIATVRSLLLAEMGWGFLPWYTVEQEVKTQKLIYFESSILEQLKYGVWWLRNKNGIENHINSAKHWLTKIKLTQY